VVGLFSPLGQGGQVSNMRPHCTKPYVRKEERRYRKAFLRTIKARIKTMKWKLLNG
jgi:hypothetical protein